MIIEEALNSSNAYIGLTDNIQNNDNLWTKYATYERNTKIFEGVTE